APVRALLAYTTLFRSGGRRQGQHGVLEFRPLRLVDCECVNSFHIVQSIGCEPAYALAFAVGKCNAQNCAPTWGRQWKHQADVTRSDEHTSELQSRENL